jgi:hypothetical protein
VHGIAVHVSQHLHFDMAGALDQSFEIDLVLAEGGVGLTAGFRHVLGQVALGSDDAHAAPDAAPRRLQHQRIANFGRHLPHRTKVIR